MPADQSQSKDDKGVNIKNMADKSGSFTMIQNPIPQQNVSHVSFESNLNSPNRDSEEVFRNQRGGETLTRLNSIENILRLQTTQINYGLVSTKHDQQDPKTRMFTNNNNI